jgi:hypothetical protein
MKIYIVKHGIYENKEITLVTFDIDKAIKHLISYSDGFYKEINSIEVWEDDKYLINYGGLNIHLINSICRKSVIVGSKGWKEKLEKPQISIDKWKEIKTDMLEFIKKAK